MQLKLPRETAQKLEDLEYIFQEFSKRVAVGLQQLEQHISPHLPSIIKYAAFLEELTKSPEFKRFQSASDCKTIRHPIYNELFEPDFSEEDIVAHWPQIRTRLYQRFPKNLDKDNRKERLNQIILCQTIGAYIPVCRSIYAELESLFRDELFFNDPEWLSELQSKEDDKKRRNYLSQQFNDVINLRHNKISFFNKNVPLEELEQTLLIFLVFLMDAFESFDPINASESDTKSFRHIHAHGWAKEVTFMDGLTAILAYDLALQLVSKVDEKGDEE